MTVWLVHHACAGIETDWLGQSDERALDEIGATQAMAIADMLTAPPVRLLSSPAAPCVETLRPLATQSGRPILKTNGLGPSASVVDVMELVTKQPAGSVLCTHGEVMESLLSIFRGVGMRLRGASLDDGWLRKGVVWRVDRDAMLVACLTPAGLVDCDRHPVLVGVR